ERAQGARIEGAQLGVIAAVDGDDGEIAGGRDRGAGERGGGAGGLVVTGSLGAGGCVEREQARRAATRVAGDQDAGAIGGERRVVDGGDVAVGRVQPGQRGGGE